MIPFIANYNESKIGSIVSVLGRPLQKECVEQIRPKIIVSEVSGIRLYEVKGLFNFKNLDLDNLLSVKS